MNITPLEKIRAKLRSQDKICPKCGHKLTIEKTDFFLSEICERCLDHANIESLETCCNNPEMQMVRFIASNDVTHVRNQCLTCGKVDGKSIGGITPQQRDNLPLMDINKKVKREDLQTDQQRSFYERLADLRKLRFDQSNDEWWIKYNNYLSSPEWRDKRARVLKRDNNRCQCCLDNLATQVHHKSYDNVDFKGSEPCYNLVSICTPCHEMIHAKN